MISQGLRFGKCWFCFLFLWRDKAYHWLGNSAMHKQAYQTGIISRQRPLVEIVQYFRETQICILEQSLENSPGETGQRPGKDYINNSIDIFYVAFLSVLSRRAEWHSLKKINRQTWICRQVQQRQAASGKQQSIWPSSALADCSVSMLVVTAVLGHLWLTQEPQGEEKVQVDKSWHLHHGTAPVCAMELQRAIPCTNKWSARCQSHNSCASLSCRSFLLDVFFYQ